MNKKILGLFLLVLLMATPAFAAMAATWNTPLSGTSYNNLPSNASNIDLNFLITDNNADVIDHNTTVRLYNSNWVLVTTIISDVNVRNTPAGTTCTPITSSSLLDRYTCNIVWDMPVNSSLGDGIYHLDVNTASVGTYEGTPIDINATRQIVINTRLATGDTLRSLMGMVGVILAGLVLIGGLMAGIFLRTDPAKTAIITVSAAIAVAIGAQIIGIVLATV